MEERAPPLPRVPLAILVLAAGLVLGWSLGVRRGTAVPRPQPLDFMDPGPAMLDRHWFKLRLVLSAGVDLRLFPRYRPGMPPGGGLGRAALGTHRLKGKSPGLGFAVHLGMRDAPDVPVPADAGEELARRRAIVLEHLRKAGTDLLVYEKEGRRSFLAATAKGWDEVGGVAFTRIEGKYPVALVLAEALEDVPELADTLRKEGAALTFLVARRDARPDLDPAGFDFVLLPDAAPSPPPASDFHVVVSDGAASGMVLDLLVPRPVPPGEVRPAAHLAGFVESWEAFREESETGPGGTAKLRAMRHVQDSLFRKLEELRVHAFFKIWSHPFRGTLEGPGDEIERAHLARDREAYEDVVKSGGAAPSALHPRPGTCASCHAEIHAAWQGTAHAKAYASLQELGAQVSPACVTCHSTGFSPDGTSGWSRMSELRGHENVGCTSCHQPAASPARPEHPWGAAATTSCRSCHDDFHDPYFRLDLALPRVNCRALVARAGARPIDG